MDTENLKISYDNFVNIYKKNNNKFQDNVQLNAYFKCRIKLQTATGVYIPNVAQPDINISLVTKNYSVLPLFKLEPDVKRKISYRITKQKRILHESRCIAYGIALTNKDPSVKNGLYWKLKKTCIKLFEKYKKSGSSTLSEMFQKECFFLGKEKFKTPDQLWTHSEGIFREMVSSILNPTPVKSLMPIYSPLYAARCGIVEFKELVEKAPTMLAGPKPVPKRQTTSAVEIQNLKMQKCEQIVDDDLDISSSNETDGKEQVIESIQLDDASNASTVNPDFKYVDELIKLKEKDTEELKNQYIHFVEMFGKHGSFEKPSDLRDFQECRVRLQIATGVYLHNVHNPDIHPSDIPLYELYKSKNIPLSRLFPKKLKKAKNNFKIHLLKSRCIATGLSILQKDHVGKRKVNHKLEILDDTFFDSSERLKILCIALEKELFDIGMNHLNLKPHEIRINNSTFLGQILSGVKGLNNVNSLISIYSPQYKVQTEIEPPSSRKSRRQRVLSKAKETMSTELIATSTERVPATCESHKQGTVFESQQTKSTDVVPSTSGTVLPILSERWKENKKKIAKASVETHINEIQGWLQNATLPPKLLENITALSVNNKKLRQSDLIRTPKSPKMFIPLLYGSAISQPGITHKDIRNQRAKMRARSANFKKSSKHFQQTESDRSKKEIRFVKENELNYKNNDSGMEYSDEINSDSENDEVNNMFIPNAKSDSSISRNLLSSTQKKRAQDNDNLKSEAIESLLDNSILLPYSSSGKEYPALSSRSDDGNASSANHLLFSQFSSRSHDSNPSSSNHLLFTQFSSRSHDGNASNANHLLFPQLSSKSDDDNALSANHFLFPKFSSRSNNGNASSENNLLFPQFSSRQETGANDIEFNSVLNFVDKLIAKREKDIKETQRVYNSLSLMYYQNGRKFPDCASKTSYVNVRNKLIRETGVILPNIAFSPRDKNDEFNIEEIEMKNLALHLMSENSNLKFKFGQHLEKAVELYVNNHLCRGSYSTMGKEAFLLDNFNSELIRLGQHITDSHFKGDPETYP